MKHILRILVGLVVTFLFIALTTPYPQANPYAIIPFARRLDFAVVNTLSIIFFSIVCTAGLSLFLWIPLWYGVGWVTFEIVGWVRKKFETKPAGEAQPSESQAKSSPTWQQKIMLNYIEKARARGLNDEQISHNLAHNGWTAGDINRAFDALK